MDTSNLMNNFDENAEVGPSGNAAAARLFENNPYDGYEIESLDPRAEADLFKPLYLRAWHNTLGAFLNWPADRIDRWAARWETWLNNETTSFFYHDTALSYVVPLLIPDTLRDRLDVGEFNRLQCRIEHAISLGNSALEMAPAHDWSEAKERVESILREYSESLPSE